MKKLLISLILACSMFVAFAQPSLPFSKGINLTLYFEDWTDNGMSPDEFYFNNPPLNLNRYDEADFACLKDMGIEVIRLVCSFDLYTDEPLGYGKIYDEVLEKLDQVCDWAEKYQIYLIIDNHNNHIYNQERNRSNLKMLRPQLEAVWTQIAPRYKNRSEYIIYEIMNEPPSKDAGKWYKLQEEMINLIRQYDKTHSIVVTCSPWSHLEDLVKMKPHKDENLIYTFHNPGPEVFNLQGASWADPAITDLSGLPFPYDKSRLPKLEGRTKNSWVQDYIQNQYRTEGTVKAVTQKFDSVGKWAAKNNVRVFCGELPSTIYINLEDRVNWIRTAVDACKKNNIAYCSWGIGEDQGFLKTDKEISIFPQTDDFEVAALEAYGFKLPDSSLIEKARDLHFPQKPYTVFDGIAGKGSVVGMWGNAKITKEDKSQSWCFNASYPAKEIGMRIIPSNIITSEFTDNADNMTISLSVKFSTPRQVFELILLDSDGGEKELPWSKSCLIRASDYSVGGWVNIELPISKFADGQGAWSDVTHKWYDLPSQFDWARFENIYFKFPNSTDPGSILIDNIVIKKK